MSNLTISTDREVLKKARLRAVREGTSVNVVLRDFMESYAEVRGERSDAVHDLLMLAKSTRSRSGGRRWSRDEVHERG
jgi:hypothetical protein